MNGNVNFNPLVPTEQEQRDMTKGYIDGTNGTEPPAITSVAYDWGRKNAVNDRNGHVDEDQRSLARIFVQMNKCANKH